MALTRVVLIARRQGVPVEDLIARLADTGIHATAYSMVEEGDALRALGQGSRMPGLGAAPTSRSRDPRFRRTLRNRRIAALGAVVAAVIAGVALWQSFSGGTHDVRISRAQPPAPVPVSATFALRGLGLRGRQPTDWRRMVRGDRVELRSADGKMVLLFSSPTSGSFAKRVQQDAERALLDSYKPAQVVTRLTGRLGGARAPTTEILATQRGRKIRILSIAAASRWRTYAVALFSGLPPPDNRLVEAQQILRSVKLTAPA
jgi:hypothetical protein